MSDRSPYIGLRSFGKMDSRIFFGRNEEIDHLLDKLDENRFIALLGTSGSGKSSLVRAGLLPALESGVIPSTEGGWQIAEMHPGEQPIRNMANALYETEWGQEYAAELEIDKDPAERFCWELNSGLSSLLSMLQRKPLRPESKMLIFVDQFEEIFRNPGVGLEQTKHFVRQLLTAVKSQLSRVYVVLTMRSDFLGECTLYRDLPKAINEGLFLVPRMTVEQISEAITMPAKVYGATVEPELVKHLLKETQDMTEPDSLVVEEALLYADQLPLLQHALMRLWYKEQEASDGPPRVLLLQTFQEMGQGSLKSVLNDHLNEIFDQELNPEEKQIAETLFRTITEKASLDRNIRRPMTLRDIAKIAEVDWAQVSRVVEKFRKAGCDFLQPPAHKHLDAVTTIDITHECITRRWRHLKDWLEKEADKANQYQALRLEATQWLKDQDDLLFGRKLHKALEFWKQENPTSSWARSYDRKNREAETSQKEFADFEDVQGLLKASQNNQEKHNQEELRISILSGETRKIFELIKEKRVELTTTQVKKLLKNEVFYYALCPDKIPQVSNPPIDSEHDSVEINRSFNQSTSEKGEITREALQGYFTLVKIHDDNGNLRAVGNGMTVVHYAALTGQKGVLECLARLKVDLQIATESKSLPLHMATFGGDLETVRFLLRNADNPHEAVNAANNQGATPLHWGSELGHSNIVDELLRAGAIPNLFSSIGVTPLFFAVIYRRIEVIEKLLNYGADPSLRDRVNQFTPLMGVLVYHPEGAAKVAVKDVVECLLNHGADSRAIHEPTGKSILQIAIENDHFDVAKLLIEKGEELDIEDQNGDTALLAALKGVLRSSTQTSRNQEKIDFENLSETLLENQHTINPKIASKGFVLAGALGNLNFLETFWRYGADPHSTDSDGNSAAHTAAQYGQDNLLEILVAHGGYDKSNRFGNTPLLDAAQSGKTKCIQVLLNSKARAEHTNKEGQTALHLAAKYGHVDVVELLLKYINPNIIDKNQIAAIHCAVLNNHLEVVDLFLNAGLDPNLHGKSKVTPLHLAASLGYDAIVHRLLRCENLSEHDSEDLWGNSPLSLAACAESTDKKDKKKIQKTVILLREKGARLPLWSEDKHDPNGHLVGIQHLEEDILRSKIAEDLNRGTNGEWPFSPLLAGPWERVPTEEAVEVLVEVKAELSLGIGTGCTGVEALRKRALACYTDAWLYEGRVFGKKGCAGYLTFLQHPQGYTVLTGSSSSPIHQLNAKLPVQLENSEQALEYLRFFCAVVHGEDGAFRLFEHPAQLLPTARMSLADVEKAKREAELISLEQVPNNTEGVLWQAEAVVKYANALFRTPFRIQTTGMVEMVDDIPVASSLSVFVEVFKAGLRTLRAIESEDAPEFHLSSINGTTD